MNGQMYGGISILWDTIKIKKVTLRYLTKWMNIKIHRIKEARQEYIP